MDNQFSSSFTMRNQTALGRIWTCDPLVTKPAVYIYLVMRLNVMISFVTVLYTLRSMCFEYYWLILYLSCVRLLYTLCNMYVCVNIIDDYSTSLVLECNIHYVIFVCVLFVHTLCNICVCCITYVMCVCEFIIKNANWRGGGCQTVFKLSVWVFCVWKIIFVLLCL